MIRNIWRLITPNTNTYDPQTFYFNSLIECTWPNYIIIYQPTFLWIFFLSTITKYVLIVGAIGFLFNIVRCDKNKNRKNKNSVACKCENTQYDFVLLM